MSEAEAPKRGRGRPRLNPVDGVRRNVTLAVSAELYDSIKQRSDESGRSLSREIELSLDRLYSGAVEATTQLAVEAARDAAYEELEEELGGRLTMMFLGIFADAFNAELRKATVDDDTNAALFKDEARRKDFGQALSSHIPGALKAIGGMFAFGNLLDEFRKMEKNNPAEFEKLVTELNRRGEARAARRVKKATD